MFNIIASVLTTQLALPPEANCIYNDAYYPHATIEGPCTTAVDEATIYISPAIGTTLVIKKGDSGYSNRYGVPVEVTSEDGITKLTSSAGVMEVFNSAKPRAIRYTAHHPNHHFKVSVERNSAEDTVQINVTGASNEILSEQVLLDGHLSGVNVADIDGNGFPEIYLYSTQPGSGSYGNVIAYASNRGKSMTPIYIPPIEQNDPLLEGYMGHDEFNVVENRLVRRFPVYKEDDPNSSPSGGWRQFQYRLYAGEAGWILKLDRTVSYGLDHKDE